MVVIGGHFDPNDVEDVNNPYPRPLFLLPLPPISPPNASATVVRDDDAVVDVLAYGGDDGLVSLIGSSKSISNETSSIASPLRRYDDEVRAMAISGDGLRIAVGYDDGSTKIYNYDDWKCDDGHADAAVDDDDDGRRRRHPFAMFPPSSSSSSSSSGCGNDVDDLFLTQRGDDALDSSGNEGASSSGGATSTYDGPRMDAPIRQMAFDPRCGTDGFPYYLAIASESGNTPLVIADVTSETTVAGGGGSDDDDGTMHLAESGGDVHCGGGVRGIAYSVVRGPSPDDDLVLLSSLGMDGRTALWDVSSNDPQVGWINIGCEMAPSVPRPDVGMNVADSADKACRPIMDATITTTSSKGGGGGGGKDEDGGGIVMYLPGRMGLQYRILPRSITALSGESRGGGGSLDGPPTYVVDSSSSSGGGGHIDSIVVIAIEPSSYDHGDGANGEWKMTTSDRQSARACCSRTFTRSAKMRCMLARHGQDGVRRHPQHQHQQPH
jgi:hypothetical protein